MSFRNLILAITFLAIFALGLRFSMDTDTWWQMRTGEMIAQQRAIPTSDSYSFTRNGEPWRYPSSAWLMELKLYFIYEWFGPGGLNLWMALVITVAFTFVYLAMSGGAFLRAFVLVLAVAVSGVYWAARPYMASFVLSAVFLWILEDFRWERRNRLVWLPILMVLWVNSHPGFSIGFILVGIYFLDELIRWLVAKWPLGVAKIRSISKSRVGAIVLIILGMLVAVMLNPSGPAIYAYPFETVSIAVLRDYVQEWQSPNFHVLGTQPFIWLLLLILAAFGAARKRVALSDFLLVSVSAYLALLAGRNMPLFALVAPVVFTRYTTPTLDDLGKRLGWRSRVADETLGWQRVLNVVIIAVLALAVAARAWSLYPLAANEVHLAGNAPVAAVEYLKSEHPEGRLFNSYNWGGYLIWNLRAYPVFVDGRTDLYSDALLTEWLNTINGNNDWQQTLDKWNIGLVLIEPSWPLAKLLPTEGWQQLYKDDQSVLFVRPE